MVEKETNISGRLSLITETGLEGVFPVVIKGIQPTNGVELDESKKHILGVNPEVLTISSDEGQVVWQGVVTLLGEGRGVQNYRFGSVGPEVWTEWFNNGYRATVYSKRLEEK